MHGLRFRAWGLGFEVWGLGFGFRVQGLGFRFCTKFSSNAVIIRVPSFLMFSFTETIPRIQGQEGSTGVPSVSYEPQSKLLDTPSIPLNNPLVIPYKIPYITPLQGV